MPDGRLSAVPDAERSGSMLPLPATGYTVTVLGALFATKISPPNTAMPSGPAMPVLLPEMMRIGATSPFAVAGNTRMLGVAPPEATKISPSRTAIALNPAKPVAAPMIVRVGAVSPLAVAGYTVMLVSFAANSSPLAAASFGVASNVEAPASTWCGAALPLSVGE